MSSTRPVLGWGQRGLYEVPVPAGECVCLAIDSAAHLSLQVMHVDGDDPLYIGLGPEQADITLADSRARMILPGQWLGFELRDYARPYPVTVMCRTAAVVSLVRV